LGLGRVLEFGQRKLDKATTMKYQKTSSSDKFPCNNLSPKVFMTGREVSLISLRNLDFVESSQCWLMSSPPIGIPKNRWTDCAEKGMIFPPITISPQFKSA